MLERIQDWHARVFEIGTVSSDKCQAMNQRSCSDEAIFDWHGFTSFAKAG
jgi:hypothetical protein